MGSPKSKPLHRLSQFEKAFKLGQERMARKIIESEVKSLGDLHTLLDRINRTAYGQTDLF